MRRIVCLPMFHTAIGPYVHTSTLRSGRESYIMKRFSLPEYLNYHRQFSITNIIIVPPMVVAIVNAATENSRWVRDCLKSVVAGVAGAAPLDAETQARFQALLPQHSVFTQLWAMTETTCVASYFYCPEPSNDTAVGRFLPNLDVKLVNPDPDSDGEEVGPYDTRGELCIRGPTVIKGYLDNPEANARDWDNEGYFRTGDILYCDSKTKLWYVVDRRKELIKVRGFQVAPNEIEGVLLGHPDVKDAAVIGVVHGEAGELPRAYVVVAEGKKLSEGDVRAWVGDRLAKYKQLEGGVKFVESIPKT
jgi:4-coumarate--CoA ligase